MIPALTETGRSFKGAAAYYLHDKRREGEKIRFTDERVAWTEALNLPTDDPERAWRMMAHTALAQAELKAASGVKATGRKLDKPVLAYSLSWHEDDKPTRDEQREAARETLKVLGLEGHQALIVAHNDTAHPHVHILVNRVNPETGLAAKLGNSRLKLSAWALAYQKQRGQTHCPEREKNHERRRKGEAVNDAGRKPRAAYEAEQAVGDGNLAGAFVKAEQRQKDAQLYETGRQLHAMHERQWRDLRQTYDAGRGRIKADADARKASAAAGIKDAGKEQWRALFQRQRQERARFAAAERSAFGKLFNLLFVFQEIKRQNRQRDGLLILAALLSAGQRRGVLDSAHEIERRALARRIKKDIDDAGRVIDRTARVDYDEARAAYLRQRDDLRRAQDRQRAQLRATWRARNAERRQALAPFKERAKRQRQDRGGGRSMRGDQGYRRPPRNRGPAPGGS